MEVREVGFAIVPVSISLIDRPDVGFRLDCLVDNGAIDTVVPEKHLEAIGARIEGHDEFELMDGRSVTLPFTLLRVEVQGKKTAGRIVFGPAESPAVLGVTALESLGFVVDPKSQTLQPQPLWLK
jgi:predicted aspartyl protease